MAVSSKIYDVAIVGAGPAGSSLAYWLTQKGFNVVIIDKDFFPRKKVCAGGLTAKITKILPFDIDSVIENKIYQVSLTHKLKSEFTKRYDKTLIYAVNRARFDDFLVKQAKNIGANFLENEKAKKLKLGKDISIILTTNKTIKAKVIVGADGADSFVAKSIGLKPFDYLRIGIQAELPIKKYIANYEDRISLDWGTIHYGYAWVFPKGDLLSVGVGGPINLGQQLKDYLSRFLKNRDLKTGNVKLTGHLIPHRISKNPISLDRVLLVGDAAGLVDFWTGEGIFYAIRSSQIAVKSIKDFFDRDKKNLMDYEMNINRILLPELKASYFFSRLFNHFSPCMSGLIKNFDYPADIFFRTMRGDRTFLEIKKRLRPDILLKKLFIKSQRIK